MKTYKKIIAAMAVVSALGSSLCAEINPNDINKKFGINFMADANLWDDAAADMTKRLGARFESTKTEDSIVYATYAKGKVLSAAIEQMRIVEKNGKVAQVDMVFFNKGDSADGKKWSQKMQRQMNEQWKVIEGSLNSFAGDGANGTWGYGKVKNKAKIWHCENMAFYLEFKPREFIILHIIPPDAEASAGQKAVAAADFDGKANVETGANGDVYIKNIPMVDQGPKGYCVPATMERILKYYSIPDVDMHKIAAVCKTNVGGGTTISSVMKDFKNVCNTFKLRMAPVNGFTMNSISALVDKGIPVCWTLLSTKPYTERMVANTEKRQKEADFDSYISFIKDQKKLPKLRDGAHICLIIGYNKKSKELAVSNSWGDSFAISWVRFDDAKTVSHNLFVISPR